MADKKITVLGDTADESLTPEEEHKIEVKIDQMLAVEQDKKTPAEDEAAEQWEPPKIEKKKSKILVIDDGADKSIDELQALASKTAEQASEPAPAVQSAPPLPKKSGKKVKISITHHDADDATEAEDTAAAEPASAGENAEDATDVPPASEEPAPAESISEPASPVKIAITDTTAGTEELPEEDAEAVQGPQSEEPDTKAAEAEAADEPAEDSAAAESPAPEPTPKSEPEPEIAPAPEPKKYRPPDGPIPFKRADPEIIDDLPAKGAAAPLSDEDAEIAKAFEEPPKRTHKKSKSGRKGLRALVVLVILVIIAAVVAVPRVRAQVLGLANMQGTLQATVVDASTHQPLSGVVVSTGGVSATTDALGKATLTHVKLGARQVTLQKTAFASASKSVVLAWKSATVPQVSLQPTGTRYNFLVTDYVSGKPFPGALVTSGAVQANANLSGVASLVMDKVPAGSTVTVSDGGYLSRTIPFPANPSDIPTVQLIRDVSDFYVAKQNGRFNVYKAGLNGAGAKVILPGTGNETSTMSVVPNGAGSYVAVVSSRSTQRDKSGYLLDTLTVVDVAHNKQTAVASAQKIRVLGWQGRQLYYTSLKADAATNDPARQQLFSYDINSQKATELDHANGFNDVAFIGGKIYYATSNHFSGGASQLVAYNTSGGGKQVLLTNEVSDIIRNDYDNLVFLSAGNTYAYKIGSAKPTPTNATFSTSGRFYVDSPDGKLSVWVDTTKGKLVLYTKATRTETVLTTQTGLAYPLRWVDDTTIIYRQSTSSIAADYVVSTLGGAPKKIVTVADASGLGPWQQ